MSFYVRFIYKPDSFSLCFSVAIVCYLFKINVNSILKKKLYHGIKKEHKIWKFGSVFLL